MMAMCPQVGRQAGRPLSSGGPGPRGLPGLPGKRLPADEEAEHGVGGAGAPLDRRLV